MILVTGGAGFIGTHTVRSLVAAGQRCVLLQRRAPQLPPQLADLPAGAVEVVQADVGDLGAVLAVGRQHPVSAVVHLAVALPWPVGDADPVEATSDALQAFLNIVRAARTWGVARVVTASTLGVYGPTADGALGEDTPVPLAHAHPVPTFKKVTELLAGHLSEATDVQVVSARISGTWGPGGHLPDPFFAAPSLALAAARRTEPDLSGLLAPPTAQDALDLMYVKDTGQALSLLATAEHLRHLTYNVGSGHATSNGDVLAALRGLEPAFHADLPPGEERPRAWLDTTRLRQDTGFTPRYDTESATRDYVAWLRDGHER